MRTVIVMEVGDLPPTEVRKAVEAVAQLHNGRTAHPTFVLPARHGRLTSDVMFETEFLDFVNKVCEVADGRIVLRGGPVDVEVIRRDA